MIASFTYEPSQAEFALLIFLAGFTALLMIVNLATSIWSRFKKKPTEAESLFEYKQEVHKSYATKLEVAQMEGRLVNQMSSYRSDNLEFQRRMEADSTHIRKFLEQSMKENALAIGRIEGKLERCPQGGCKNG